MSAACPVRAKDVFLPSISHLCWFKFWSSWSLCVVFRRKWGRRESWKAWERIAMEEEKVFRAAEWMCPWQGWWDGRSSACRSWAIEESPAGGREPDAASSPLQHLRLPVCPSFSYCFLHSGSLPSSLLVACPGDVRRWSLVELGVPSCWQQGRCQDPWGQLGDPAPHQSCLRLNFVLVLKTNVLFADIFSASESCSLRPNMVVLKEKYF